MDENTLVGLLGIENITPMYYNLPVSFLPTFPLVAGGGNSPALGAHHRSDTRVAPSLIT
ncbi:MAG TPA: hypothetical protein VM735_07385 [Candidatus Kapabacteria bacterium]|nr:hypothetical protein [Candidatus Kapabacteria bacterium]